MKRTINTAYYDAKHNLIRNNASSDANRAVATCVLHMQVNQYAAASAEVYDNETGELHAAIKRSVNTTITITYRRDPTKYERKLSLSVFH
jgi:hypothetical protein